MNKHPLPESLLDDIALAIKTQTSILPLPKGITVEDAYAALPHLVKRVTDDRLGGLKAGVTNTDIQAFLGLDEALLVPQNRAPLIIVCQSIVERADERGRDENAAANLGRSGFSP